MTVTHYLLFALDDQSYAVHIEAVESVLRAAALTRVPDAPERLSGLINVHGSVVPVLDIRKRFNLPPRELSAEDRIILCKTSATRFAFVVDRVDGVSQLTEGDMRGPGSILPDMEGRVEGVGVVRDHTVLIYDIDRLFSSEDVDAPTIDRLCRCSRDVIHQGPSDAA